MTVRLRVPNVRAWLMSDRLMKALLGGQVVLAGLSVVLHAVTAIRRPEHRLTEISCGVAWLCVTIWALGTWRWSRMYYEMRALLEQRMRGGQSFTSG